MARQVAIPCIYCGQKFGGQATFDRHRYIAGDRYGCRTPEELASRGFYRDRWTVWHREANPGQTSLLGVTESDRRPYPATLYNGSPPSERVNTSEAAAASMKEPSNSIRGRVLETIRYAGPVGMTDDELEQMLGLRHQTASARRRELYLLGKIQSTGERKTRSGRRAKVWVVR